VQHNAQIIASQPADDPWSVPNGALTATDLAARTWAPATLAAYHDDWNRFVTWCHTAAGLDDPLDADDHHVADYIATLVRTNSPSPRSAAASPASPLVSTSSPDTDPRGAAHSCAA
jgi:hypothetical protein